MLHFWLSNVEAFMRQAFDFAQAKKGEAQAKNEVQARRVL
jgi:hypothetical protein